jgi:bifunctional DNA-binding transcriptional regulator/antitoxin component of YhaV-PrlF toxin-antitoxin module
MVKQERKFPLAEVHTKIGTEGEITFDKEFMGILGVKPGDWIAFFIDERGVVTVKGEKKAAIPVKPSGLSSSEVTQPALFDAGQSTPKPNRQRRRNS